MDLSIEDALALALAAHAEDRLHEARSLYEAILQSLPEHPDANYHLGLLTMSEGKTGTALQLFATAITANPNNESFWFGYVECLLILEEVDEATKMLTELRKSGASESEVTALETRAQRARAKQSNAKQIKLSVSERRKRASNKKKRKRQQSTAFGGEPSEQELSELLQLYQGSQLAKAEQLALKITGSFPNHQFGWKVLGAIFKDTGRLEESLRASHKSVQLSPDDAEAHNNLGAVAKELGKLADAETSFRTAISLDKNQVGAHRNLGNTLYEQGRLLQAEAAFRSAVALQPNFSEHHYNLGVVLSDLGQQFEAEAHFREAIAKNPQHAEAFNNLGILLFKANKILEAKELYLSAIKLKPGFADAHHNLGVALKALGESQKAKDCFSAAINLRSNFESALLARSELSFENGDFEKALQDADSCNSEGSRVAGLLALLAQNRVDEIFSRLYKYSKSSEENLRMAAFASFISRREGRDAGHNFCPNPLDFIYKSKVSNHLENADVFLDDLVTEVLTKDTVWEPSGKATYGGYQTHANTLFENTSQSLTQLKTIILQELDKYHHNFRDDPCLFIQRWPKKPNIQGWHVVLKAGGFQIPHIHPDGWLSGVIYLKVVPSLGNNEGAIEFSLNSTSYSDSAMPEKRYQPERGDIILFPSSLHHRTLPFTTEGERIIVSFDLRPPSFA